MAAVLLRGSGGEWCLREGNKPGFGTAGRFNGGVRAGFAGDGGGRGSHRTSGDGEIFRAKPEEGEKGSDCRTQHENVAQFLFPGPVHVARAEGGRCGRAIVRGKVSIFL
jgi:hypothetical protein